MDILKLANALHRPKQDEGGFTLIELLIVIAILAILAAIAIPLVGSRVAQAKDAADEANVHMLQAAVDLYVLDSDEIEETRWIETLKNGGYLSDSIKNPYDAEGDPEDQYELDSEEVVSPSGKVTIYKVTSKGKPGEGGSGTGG